MRQVLVEDVLYLCKYVRKRTDGVSAERTTDGVSAQRITDEVSA